MDKPLDHGILNVPLHKRGDIDRDLDRYKAQQAKEKRERMKAASARFAADKREALGLIERMTDEHIDRWAARMGCQKRSVRKRLRSEAGIVPRMLAKALREGGAE